jgi:uncharacterized SAM-binding protein YcdF (DUF218 family)
MFLLLAVAAVILVYLPSLLIVDEKPQQADLIVVLGGGTSSRFRKGLALSEAGFADQLLLVDRSKNDWAAILQEACQRCWDKIIYLEGSKDTFSDAVLTEQHCRRHGMKSVLVVTDPYHTRRAALIFKDRLAGSGISVRIVSSGYFGDLRRPDQKWWQDNATLKTVWTEANKNFIILLRHHGLLAD